MLITPVRMVQQQPSKLSTRVMVINAVIRLVLGRSVLD